MSRLLSGQVVGVRFQRCNVDRRPLRSCLSTKFKLRHSKSGEASACPFMSLSPVFVPSLSVSPSSLRERNLSSIMIDGVRCMYSTTEQVARNKKIESEKSAPPQNTAFRRRPSHYMQQSVPSQKRHALIFVNLSRSVKCRVSSALSALPGRLSTQSSR